MDEVNSAPASPPPSPALLLPRLVLAFIVPSLTAAIIYLTLSYTNVTTLEGTFFPGLWFALAGAFLGLQYVLALYLPPIVAPGKRLALFILFLILAIVNLTTFVSRAIVFDRHVMIWSGVCFGWCVVVMLHYKGPAKNDPSPAGYSAVKEEEGEELEVEAAMLRDPRYDHEAPPTPTRSGWITFLYVVNTCAGLLFTLIIIMAAAASVIYAADFITSLRYPPGDTVEIKVAGVPVMAHVYCDGIRPHNKAGILLLHGAGANHGTWMQVLDLLTKDTRVCAIDALGYGFSSSSIKPSSPELHYTFFEEAMKAMGETGPFWCVGHSAGGEQCVRMAARKKMQITGVVVIDGVPDTYDVEWGLARNWTLDTIIAERYRIKRVLDVARAFSVVGVPYLLLGNGNYGAWSALVASLYHQPRYWDAQYSDYLPGIESGLNVSLYNSQRPRLDVPVRVLGARANHTCHFLNITGPECTEQELTGPVTWRLQEETAALSTVSGKARRCSVPGCNHAVVWEHPAYVADLLWGWVKDWPVRN